MVIVPPAMHDSAVSPWFHGYLAFLHWHFLPQSPPSHSFNPSLFSQQQPSPWDCSTIPKLHLPAAVPSRGPVSLSRVCMAVTRTIWFSFHLSCHRSTVSLSALNVSPLSQTIAPLWGTVPPPTKGRSNLTNTLVFPPTSFILRSFVLFYVFFFSFFPLGRYSYLLSAGVLHALLFLKVYSWCIHGERCTPQPLTPPPSCSPLWFLS